MELGIDNRLALVMGASTGLGYAVAKSLIAEGAKVVIAARDTPRLADAAQRLGAYGFLPCDLNKADAAQKLVADCEKKYGPPEILVVNGGGPPKGHFEEVSTQMWNEGFQSLWLSATQSIATALPAMKAKKWGRILIVTSVSAKEPMNQLTISNGFRAGLLGLTKSISNEVAGSGVTINAILPGFTDTERLQELKVPKEKITAQIPAGRIGRPEEFAALVTFLASEPAAYISGQTVACDGGYLRGI